MVNKKYIFTILFIILIRIKSIRNYYITIDAHMEECFFERTTKGSQLSLIFEVVEGGFLDIDVKITGPDGKVIYQGDRESSGKYAFSALTDGVYSYCFGNKMSTMTPKILKFSIDEIEPQNDTNINGKHAKLEDMIKELSNALVNVKKEQEYMTVRASIHRLINENTNSRVIMWSFFEAFVLVAMTLGQIYYLKRFFEVRRVI